MGQEIFLYIPNIIGYVRLLILMTAWFAYLHPLIFLPLYCLSVALDGLDGYAARKLNQRSAFGAWLDIVVDILGRGMLWCRLYSFGYLVAALEWLTFVCTHTLGAEWKSSFLQTPWIVRNVMADSVVHLEPYAVFGQ